MPDTKTSYLQEVALKGAYAGALYEMENFRYSDGTKLLDHIKLLAAPLQEPSMR